MGDQPKRTKPVYQPFEAVDNTIEVIEDLVLNPTTGVLQGIPNADFLSPWRPGELIGVLGFTSNGKSSLISYFANQHAHALRSYGRIHGAHNHVVVYASWEQSIEEQTIFDLSRVTNISPKRIFRGELSREDLDALRGTGADDRKSLPIWLIGTSMVEDIRRVRLNINELVDTLAWITETAGMKIDLLVLDYLQRIRRKETREMREGFVDLVDRVKDLATHFPIILASQAKREVNDRPWKMPLVSDGQETSNFEQSCDHLLACYMPKNYFKPESLCYHVDVNDTPYIVKDNLLFMTYWKQKFGPSPIHRGYYIGFGGTYLSEIPTEDQREALIRHNERQKEKGKSK